MPPPLPAMVNSLPPPMMSMQLNASTPGQMASSKVAGSLSGAMVGSAMPSPKSAASRMPPPRLAGMSFAGVAHPPGPPPPSNQEILNIDRGSLISAVQSSLSPTICQAMANGATAKAAQAVFCAGLEVQTKAAPRKPPPWRSPNGMPNGQAIEAPLANSTSESHEPSHRNPKRHRPCIKIGRYRSSKRVRWHQDPDGEPRLAEVLIEAFRAEGDRLWYMNPGAIVLCDGCENDVPQNTGMLCGSPGNSAFAQASFMCLVCLERAQAAQLAQQGTI